MRLSELKTGESATILKVTGHGGFRRRIMEMGFVRGQRVEVLLNAPLKDPIEYKIMGYDISLRRTEADMVVVLSDSEVNEYLAGGHHHHRHHPGHRHGHCGCGMPEQAPEYPAAGTPDADDDCATADEVISRHSGMPLERVFELTASDTYFEAQAAVDAGLADRIITTL
mgnify:CR=1 FL=1